MLARKRSISTTLASAGCIPPRISTGSWIAICHFTPGSKLSGELLADVALPVKVAPEEVVTVGTEDTVLGVEIGGRDVDVGVSDSADVEQSADGLGLLW